MIFLPKMQVLEVSIKHDVDENSGIAEESEGQNRSFSFQSSGRSNSEESGKQVCFCVGNINIKYRY